MSAESDAFIRLLRAIETKIAAVRHEERQHVKTLERMGDQIAALLTLLRAIERGEGQVVPPRGLPPPPIPPAAWIRMFLDLVEPVARQADNDGPIVAVLAWLEMLAGAETTACPMLARPTEKPLSPIE